ncbi:MAG TPA: aminoacyl-histidine dipeptidase [Prolixibacteraceae bacterium]|nr:aminoacyl-histidine dipeptidase [Prolixibacteraceae bacterium]
MSEEIKKLEPRDLWCNFYSLTQIPRPSKKEKKAALFIREFGEQLGLETRMDAAGNVLIRKPPFPGYENRKTVVLQAHIDMVPQANSSIEFNFDTDPIDAFIDGEWVSARDTTLGADNGIGVAASLAVLQNKNLEHGPIEVLVTVDEEAGMTGAFRFQPGILNADLLINLDTENENEISVGCAGGVDTNATWTYTDDKQVAGDRAYLVSITGLKGGHSGLDIHLGRGNACKLMGRFLKKAVSGYGARLSSIDCGNMRNAIPREAFALVTVPDNPKKRLIALVDEIQQVWANELGRVEPGMKIEAKEVDMTGTLIPEMVQDDLINTLCALRNGIIRMSDTMPGVVETSTNLSIVKSSVGTIEAKSLTRSFIDSARDGIASSLESCFALGGAKITHTGTYPGWKPNPDSQILAVAREAFTQLKGFAPGEKAMHAGLECGILGASYPNLDIISIGPSIQSPHSPDERVHIASVKNFWEWLTLILRNIPEKE